MTKVILTGLDVHEEDTLLFKFFKNALPVVKGWGVGS